MSDDQDGCEWVNVYSGTGLGLYTRVVPDKRPLNGCVCVCVCVCSVFVGPTMPFSYFRADTRVHEQ